MVQCDLNLDKTLEKIFSTMKPPHGHNSPRVRQLRCVQSNGALKGWEFLAFCQLNQVAVSALGPREQPYVFEPTHAAHRDINTLKF